MAYTTLIDKFWQSTVDSSTLFFNGDALPRRTCISPPRYINVWHCLPSHNPHAVSGLFTYLTGMDVQHNGQVLDVNENNSSHTIVRDIKIPFIISAIVATLCESPHVLFPRAIDSEGGIMTMNHAQASSHTYRTKSWHPAVWIDCSHHPHPPERLWRIWISCHGTHRRHGTGRRGHFDGEYHA